jgi:stage II sporulation protein M
MSLIKRFYFDEWVRFKTKYLKIFLIVCILFIVISLLSYAFLVSHPDKAFERIAELQRHLLGMIPPGATGYKLFSAIFFNNLRASFFAIVLGMIPFLFLPILGVFRNGLYMGAVTAMTHLKGLSVFSFFLIYIAPHGVFELPAMLYSVCMGIYLSLNITKKFLAIGPSGPGELSLLDQEKKKEESVFNAAKGIVRTWIGVVIPLLLVAAVIETFLFSAQRQ